MIEINHKLLLNNMNYSVAEHELVYDNQGNPIDYRYVYVNLQFCKSLGVSENEILGKNVYELFPETEKFWLTEYAEVVRTGSPKEFTHYSAVFDKYFSVYSFKTKENHFVTSFKDVTDFIKNSMDKNMDSELLRTFSTSSKAAFFEFDIRKNTIDYSENLLEILGVNDITMEKYQTEFFKMSHPEDLRRVSYSIARLSRGEIDEVTIEMRVLNDEKDDYVWISFFAYVSKKLKHIPIVFKGIVRDITVEKKVELDHNESSQIFAQTRRIANITTFLYYPDVMTFDQSQELLDFLGLTELNSLEDFRKIIYPEDLKFFDAATTHILNQPSGGSTYRIVKNGEIRYIQSSLFSLKNNKGITSKVSGILRDITQEELNRRVIENSRRSFSQIFDSSPAGIFILDDDFKITMRNEKFIKFTGNKKTTVQEFLGDQYLPTLNHMRLHDTIEDIEITYYLESISRHYLVSIITMIGLDNKYQGTVIDITDSVEQGERIKFLATRDMLTKIYNRNYFEGYTKNLNGRTVGIVMCDIDGLKLINDAFGHLEGDKLLIQFAAHLNHSFGNDMVARLGGDEFAVLAFDKTDDELEEYEQVIKRYVGDLYMFGINIGVSVGYSVKEPEGDFYKAFVRAENIMYRRKLTERSSRKSNALSTIMQTLHEKTHETKEHCERVGDYAVELLKAYGRIRTYELEEMRLVSSVHDIGKIAISEHILSKDGPLSNEEYELIKNHSESGYKIASNIISNDDIAIAILYHHEKWDGSGYPHNLEGEQIPLYARVVSIADAFDTMISGRIYQKRISLQEAKKELLRCAGTQFDPHLVNLFIEYLEKQ